MFNKLISWSLKEFHYLPWRSNRTLYRTLVSEIMLQQTTVSTVLNHFEQFISVYPDFQSVANATDDELTISWKGLGYYRRARNLKKACEEITNKYDGRVPQDFEVLKTIPGIGDYTASALIAIGNNQKQVAIDANLERVLSRFYMIDEVKGIKLQKRLRELFLNNKILSEMNKLSPRELNEALMDLGRNYCKSRKAFCDLCPLSGNCMARKSGRQLEIPIIEGLKKTQMYDLELLRVIVKRDNKLLAYKKSKKQWLEGQFELPTFILYSEDENCNQYPNIDGDNFYYLNSIKSFITKYKIVNYVLYIDIKEISKLGISEKSFEWIDYKSQTANLSTASLKSIGLY